MTEQEYKHIRNLSWDVLIETGANSLPIQLDTITNLYQIKVNEDNYYNKAIQISSGLLSMFGLNNSLSETLAIRLLSPMIVLKEVGVCSGEDISKLTGLPIWIANKRYERLQMLIKRNAFCTSRLEQIVLKQFEPWISQQKSGRFRK